MNDRSLVPATTHMAKLYDVTVPLSAQVPTFPGDPAFRMDFVHRMADGKPYNVAHLDLGAHAGTHVDAPYHFLADGATVDQLPLEILLGKARVVGMAGDAIRRVDIEELDLSDDLRVLFKTRNSGQLRTGPFQEDFVYLDPDAASYLADQGIKLVGIDSLSIERFGSKDFAAHHALLGAGVVVLEGLDLSDVDPGDYDMTCLPLRIVGADASPARVVLKARS
jgi:arylformamidase